MECRLRRGDARQRRELIGYPASNNMRKNTLPQLAKYRSVWPAQRKNLAALTPPALLAAQAERAGRMKAMIFGCCEAQIAIS